MHIPRYILPLIVLSQFLCTSLWFAGNGVMSELMTTFELETQALGALTSMVQLGFIVGTLLFALLSIADRYSPSKVFFYCALLGALFNLGITWPGNTYGSILVFRFFTGFFLAGIYPVGMKIAADYFEKGLGKSLGFLVGALVIGTAFPHLLKELKGDFPWEFVLLTTSVLAVVGGVLIRSLVPDGPFRKPAQQVNLSAIPQVFKIPAFRAAAFGYFGHMWELYTFWAFVPFILQRYVHLHPEVTFNVPLLSFCVIGVGGVACVLGGYLAQSLGVKRTAFIALSLSALCCLLAPVMFGLDVATLFIAFLLVWGMTVIADSPLFSTLVAQHAPLELRGTALTIVNSLGFLLTIISIQLINSLRLLTDSTAILLVLAIGPLLGLWALSRPQSSITKRT